MDEVTRLAMRRKHAERSEVCPCGRRVYGNGRSAHFRACRYYLTEHGYPLDEGLCSAIREEHGPGVVIEVQRRLGALQVSRRGKSEYAAEPDLRRLRWRDFRDLVWKIADEVAS